MLYENRDFSQQFTDFTSLLILVARLFNVLIIIILLDSLYCSHVFKCDILPCTLIKYLVNRNQQWKSNNAFRCFLNKRLCIAKKQNCAHIRHSMISYLSPFTSHLSHPIYQPQLLLLFQFFWPNQQSKRNQTKCQQTTKTQTPKNQTVNLIRTSWKKTSWQE